MKAAGSVARVDPLLASVPVLSGLAAGIVAVRLYPRRRNGCGALSPADLEKVPHSEECAWQQHENKPRADISHEEARKRRLSRAGDLHYLGGRERGMALALGAYHWCFE